MTIKSTHTAAVPIPPPLLFFVCLGAGFLMERFFPLDIPELPGPAQVIAGGLFAAAAGFFALGAFAVMARQKTPFNPAKETLVVVRSGPFRFSRNPMYLSLILLMIGIAFFLYSPWYLVTALILLFLLNNLAVKPEEKYLTEKFGQQYLGYKTRVRRWI